MRKLIQSAYHRTRKFGSKHPTIMRAVVFWAPFGWPILAAELVWVTYQNLKQEEIGMVSFKSLRKSHDWLFATVVFVLVACLAIIITLIPVLYVIDYTTLALFDYLLWRMLHWASVVAMFAILSLSTTPSWRKGMTLLRGHYYCPTEKKRGFLWRRCENGEN